jgi:hypothetical protein
LRRPIDFGVVILVVLDFVDEFSRRFDSSRITVEN